MKKRLIEQMVVETNQVQEPTYNLGGVYVGYIAKTIMANNGKKVKQVVNTKPIMFKYGALGYYQDIETGNYYPLLNANNDNIDGLYIPERYLHDYIIFCAETLKIKGIDVKSRLTVGKLREIIKEQELNKEMYFN